MNVPFIKAKALQIILFIPRMTLLTIFNRELNSDLRGEGFIISPDPDLLLTPLELHRLYFKVYPDGTTGG